jgi:3,4-dihydroxy 2-butanone 4-phosphate synthase/GTP cyclohydrolase II
VNETIKKALSELAAGRFVLVCDAKDRENEADLIMAAQFVDSSRVNFMINHGRGLICVPLTKEKAKKLKLDLMVPKNEGTLEVAFTVSVDAKEGTLTGISSKDRARTILHLSNENAAESDFVTPGHMFPLIAHPGGLLARAGHTEAAVELMKMAGLTPVAVLCETLNIEGEPLKGETLIAYARNWNIPIVSIEEIIDHLKIT